MALLDQREDFHSFASTTLLDSRWMAVERIVASRNFAKSGRLNTFLSYIVRCAIENRPEEISEQQIGIHVFGRSPGYNPAEDNIVRTTARQLRQRLALYYMEEGSADIIRIEVPKGGYIPVFQSGERRSSDPQIVASESAPVVHEHPAIAALPETASTPRKRIGLHIPRGWLNAAALVVAGAVLALTVQACISAARLRTSENDALWRTLFSSKQTTLFVPGDAGLNMFNNQAHAPRQVALADYIGGKYLYSPKAQSPDFAGAPISSRRYVNIADLQFADRIAALARVHRDNYQIKFPRDMTTADFRNASVILSGAPVYNPWDELFDGHLNFHIVYDGAANNSMYIENRKPLAGEPSVYTTDWKKVFGYIALTDNLDNNGKVLLIEGTSHVGVEAAVDFLFNDKKMAPILAKARQSSGEPTNFEVLLDAASPNNSGSGQAEVLATRFYSPGN
jgi:hypothetical protein